MSELAVAAGVSVGQIYRLFTGKNAVIQAIVMEDAAAKMGELQTMNDSVKSERFSIEEGFVELARRALSKGDEALSFEIMAEAHRNADVADTIADLCRDFRRMIRELACVANPDLARERTGRRGGTDPRLHVRAWPPYAVAAAVVGGRDGAIDRADDPRRGARALKSRRKPPFVMSRIE